MMTFDLYRYPGFGTAAYEPERFGAPKWSRT